MSSPVIIQQSPQQLVKSFLSGKQYSAVAVLADVNTYTSCYSLIKEELPPHHLITLEAGEEYKNLESCQHVWKELTHAGLDRHALLIVLGGGVLGDLGGFCAATYKRGIDFVLVPTTLLAQVDASIGGKLGIDFLHFKNHIGIFCEPVATLISPAFLSTLPHRELRSGFAEIIKHCLISDKEMWGILKSKPMDKQDWDQLIDHSVKFKQRVIEEDPREKGLRKILNFGHTVGHAVESYFLASGNRIYHGEAIAIGMIAESRIASKKGLLSESELVEITTYIKSTYPEVKLPADTSALLAVMAQDKKNKGNKILMALTAGIGQAKWDVEVSEGEIRDSLGYYQTIYT